MLASLPEEIRLEVMRDYKQHISATGAYLLPNKNNLEVTYSKTLKHFIRLLILKKISNSILSENCLYSVHTVHTDLMNIDYVPSF